MRKICFCGRCCFCDLRVILDVSKGQCDLRVVRLLLVVRTWNRQRLQTQFLVGLRHGGHELATAPLACADSFESQVSADSSGT